METNNFQESHYVLENTPFLKCLTKAPFIEGFLMTMYLMLSRHDSHLISPTIQWDEYCYSYFRQGNQSLFCKYPLSNSYMPIPVLNKIEAQRDKQIWNLDILLSWPHPPLVEIMLKQMFHGPERWLRGYTLTVQAWGPVFEFQELREAHRPARLAHTSCEEQRRDSSSNKVKGEDPQTPEAVLWHPHMYACVNIHK